ncbi:MAG: carbamoyltransferase [Omnitrophica bacterium]|nr:carbamoyltransferase [Candidatus Omnitrophota bacterium]
MLILGIHDGHDATAALLIDGRVVACASNERWSRLKNDGSFPCQAIDHVLSVANIRPHEIDMVALSTKSRDPIRTKTNRIACFKKEDFIREMHEYWRPLLYENTETDYWRRLIEEPAFKDNNKLYDVGFLKTAPKKKWAELFNEERIRVIVDYLGVSREKVSIIDHHTTHAYYAYFASPRDYSRKSAIVTADGWGDGCNATVSIGENGVVREIHRTPMCNIARIYRWITLLLGMRPHEHEYKVMGLAPYSKKYIYEPVYNILKETLVVDGLDFKWNEKPQDMYFYFRKKFEGFRFDGIACGLQLWLEDLLTEWMTNIMAHTSAQALYYSGGLSLNIKANKAISELSSVRDFHVPPGSGDASTAIGAAYFLSVKSGSKAFPLENAYLGYEPTREEAAKATETFKNDPAYRVIDSPDADLLASLLADGKVLARCVGRMEFGPRALGNRSIICDPSKYENIRVINEKIKLRDFWMPFTPSILHERARDYILNPKGLFSHYMTIAFSGTQLARRELAAAIHPYDFTVRPQLVTSEINGEYYSLIKAFERKTGIGALLNTSFNLHGEPIVCTPGEAVETFKNSGLDGVILPDVAVLKSG